MGSCIPLPSGIVLRYHAEASFRALAGQCIQGARAGSSAPAEVAGSVSCCPEHVSATLPDTFGSSCSPSSPRLLKIPYDGDGSSAFASCELETLPVSDYYLYRIDTYWHDLLSELLSRALD